MGVSDTTEEDWENHYNDKYKIKLNEVKIPQELLNIISDINIEEINSHIYTNEKLLSWLCSWHEAVKRELYDFANNHELYRSGYHRAINDVIIEMCADCKKSPCWDAMPQGCYQYDKLKEMRDKV